MNQSEQLAGTVERIVYCNEENGFTVFNLLAKNNQKVTVKGYAATIHAGEQVILTGTWVVHPKFGKQFEARNVSACLPTTIIGIKKYLSSGLIKGIGPVYAEKLVNQFGDQVLTIIDETPQLLHQVDGIGPKRVERIIKAWQDQREISNIMVFLQEKNISPTYATKIYKKYGNQAVSVLIENPYRLADDIWGIGFKVADTIAQNMGFAKDSLKRVIAALQYTLSTHVGLGHLYAQVDELKEKTAKILDLEPEVSAHKLKLGLHELYNQDKIKLITHNEKHFVALTQHYFCEKNVAHKINELLSYPTSHQFDLDAVYAQLRKERTDGMCLNEDQQQGIMMALQKPVSIITGGPGTGKTTLITSLLQILDQQKKRYKLAAPTGRAAKRITQSTRRHALTLHRLLEFDPSNMGFTRNESNALAVDFLIVDEASMIDIFLAHALLKAVPLGAHIIFIGDVDQLPSVGAGNVLRDMIESKKVPTTRLTKIFRQAQNSLIIINAHRINKGEFPTKFAEHAKRDFLYIQENDPEMVPVHLEHIYQNGLKKWHIAQKDAITLVPMNRGSVGTQKLNFDLQKILNPKEYEHTVTVSGSIYKPGDRVMQIRNNYDKVVFNGDIGTIEQINQTDKELKIIFDDRDVTYDFSELDELVHAYAISIHKSQGSEYAAVVIPIFTQHFTLLQRNLIYTAITRAKKLCIFIGQTRAIAMGIKNTKGTARTTFLPNYLTTDLACRS